MLVLAAGAANRRAVVLPLIAGLVFVVGFDFELPTYRDVDWPVAAACIASEGTCRVEVWPSQYSFTWPGAALFDPPSGSVEVVDHQCCRR